MQYLFRAKRSSMSLPPAKRLAWLQQRDVEERSEWVARFRDSTKSLVVVMKEVFGARDAHWTSHSAGLPDPPFPPVPPGEKATSVSGAGSFALGKPIGGKAVARVMRDGTKLCQAFQHGQCKGGCGQAHRCALVTKKQRVCGFPGHGAATCRNNPKSS